MFNASTGTYVGTIAVTGDVGDVAIMDNQLYVLAYSSGVRVYDLNGTSLPSYSHTISFPTGVSPSSTWGDELYASGDFLYLSEDTDEQWHKINLSGTLLESYDLETRGTYNSVGSMAIATLSVGLPEINIKGMGRTLRMATHCLRHQITRTPDWWPRMSTP